MRTFLFALLFLFVASLVTATPLDDYVNAPDTAFKWFYTGHSFDGLTYTGYVYNLTSQNWLTSAESNMPTWTHHVVVVIPKDMDPDYEGTAMMYITGGDNNNPTSYPDAKDEDVFVTAAICVNAKLPCAVLYQVPNQPITYTNDPWHKGGRSEDDNIALTWWQYLQDPTRPDVVLELPMTKSGTKCMDMMQQVIPKYTKTGKPVTRFAVGGASKRGWTTWLVGAVDPRVKAILPIVLDAAYLTDFMRRQFTYYGAWTFALEPYRSCNVTIDAFTSPNWQSLMSFVDMASYFDRVNKLPRYVVNAVGDEFQMPDDWRSFWNKQPFASGIKMGGMMIGEHSLVTAVPEVLTAVSAFVEGYLGGKKTLPLYNWNISDVDGTITLTTSEKPTSVVIQVADSAQGVSKGRRDFRWAAINATPCEIKVFGACVRLVPWVSSPTDSPYITKISDTQYSAKLPLPEAGVWRAFMLEFRFANPYSSTEYLFTTGVSVIPDTAPFPMCSGAACYGTLC